MVISPHLIVYWERVKHRKQRRSELQLILSVYHFTTMTVHISLPGVFILETWVSLSHNGWSYIPSLVLLTMGLWSQMWSWIRIRLFRPVRRFSSAINHLHGDKRMTQTFYFFIMWKEKWINTMIVFSGVTQLTSGFASSVFLLNKSGQHDKLWQKQYLTA